MFYDLVRQNKVTSTSVFADIISNYDLLVHSISSPDLHILNVSKETINCTFSTLKNMVHSVRTDFGDSDNTYRGDIWEILLKPPPHGLGQGNGAAPSIWAIVSSPATNCLREAGHVAVFK